MGSTLPPLVAAVRIDTEWNSRRPRVTCVARLTRPLTESERREMARFPEFDVDEDRVTYSCRPEEAEASEERLSGALLASTESSPTRGPRRLPPLRP